MKHYVDSRAVQGALRADDTAQPPLNMRKSLIFNGAFIMAVGSTIFFLKGEQVRKEMDEVKMQESKDLMALRSPEI